MRSTRLPVLLGASAAYCLLLWVAWTQEDESAARVAQAQAGLQAQTIRARALEAQVVELQARIAAMHRAYTVSATWYGRPYHGRLASSGERFDREARTIACNWLPMYSRVLLSNDICAVIATVNDHMPTGTPSGKIDVSERIAREMGWQSRGRTTLRLEVLP